MVRWLKGTVSCISMPLKRPQNIIIPSYLYVRAVGGTPGLSSGSSAPGSVSNDGPSVFKWPVISSEKHIKMDFRWGKQTWACCFWPSSFISQPPLICLHRDKIQGKKNTHTAILQINNQLTKAGKLFIINNRRVCKAHKETEESRLQFTGWIFNRQHLSVNSAPVPIEAVTNERQTESKRASHRGNGMNAQQRQEQERKTKGEVGKTANHFTAFIKLSLDFTAEG